MAGDAVPQWVLDKEAADAELLDADTDDRVWSPFGEDGLVRPGLAEEGWVRLGAMTEE